MACPYPVEVENTAACPRYMGVTIEGITVGESPEWLKNRLLAVGQRPINNVVDVTNYVRIELGQPLHAFDLDKIKGGKILVKTLPDGTPFKTLDGVEHKLLAEDLMICDAESTPMCIGGVFGGADSGVSNTTTKIFLEAAIFNAKWIRRTMLRHNLRTDSSWVFEKGADPDNTDLALTRAALLIQQLTGGKISSQFVNICPVPPVPASVPVSYSRVNALIGEALPKARVNSILDALGICPGDETTTEGFHRLYSDQQARCDPRSGCSRRNFTRPRARQCADSIANSQQHRGHAAPQPGCRAQSRSGIPRCQWVP